MPDAILVYNPASGSHRARRLPAIRDALSRAGYDAEPRPTAGPGDATGIARQAAANGARAVFAMGGDGTLREAAVGLLGSDSTSNTVLGILPAGTANVLALSLGLPRHALDAARRMADCRPREIDVGIVETSDESVPFLMMASCGLDAAVLERQSPRLKKLLGRAAFTLGALRSWWSYSYSEVEARTADAVHPARLVVVANVPFYGGAFRMAPAASLTDGQLDLVAFRGGRWASLGFGWDLVLGRHTARADVTAAAVRRVEIDAPAAVRMQIDGDVLAAAPPWTVRLAEESLRVLLPV